jgi:hypothetical protein
VLLGCQQDSGGTDPRGFEPSPASMQDDDSSVGTSAPGSEPGEPDSLATEPGEGEADDDGAPTPANPGATN